MTRFLFWAPRLVGGATAVFLASFALDAFGPGVALSRAAADFVIHLLPAGLVAALVLLACRFPAAGGLLLIGVSALPFVLLANALWVNVTLAGPIFAAGALFVAAAVRRRASPA